MGEILALARGPSGMLMASTPASAQRRTFASISVMSQDRGGTISTDVTFSPAISFPASRDFFPVGITCTRGSWRAYARTFTCFLTPLNDLTARDAMRIWAGVVPQHP